MIHKPFSDQIDDAYVINLDRRGDRLERLWGSSPELETRVERWGAVDGRKLQLSPAIASLLKPNDFFWKKAIAGCALSHLGLWWKLANETPDISNYLILEDDVKFRPDWERVWKSAVADGDVPEDYDIIYLGGVLPPNRSGFEESGKERFNDSFSRIKENTCWGQVTPNRYFHFCAYAYILTKAGAQKILGLLESSKGYWTSADHILCNPVDTLKSYVLDPMVAGCYQDDDPKYANSQFNDFSRVDGFDSDLWNNDERWTAEEIQAVGGEEFALPIVQQALADAKGIPAVAKTVAAPTQAVTTQPVATPTATQALEPLPSTTVAIPLAERATPTTPARRFLCTQDHALSIRQLHECDWLLEMFGNPTTFTIEQVRPNAPPPSDCPVVILQKPHIQVVTDMLERWSSFGAKFYILHLSDEDLSDPLDVYELEGCVRVMRFYVRTDVPCEDKVTTIPLGYHWPRREPHQDILVKTPKLPFRLLNWSFVGTGWVARAEQLKLLMDIPELSYKTVFLETWKDPNALSRESYIEILLDSVFVPCPDGMNPETFRFYEALEFGCIPLVVKTEKNAAWVDWVSEHMSLLPMASWEDAAKCMAHLLQNKELLEKYRDRLLTSWMAWKKELFAAGVEWLK